jgi:hypothetical protein
LLFVFAACVALACADLVVSSASGLPQNTNSSTTDETTRGGQMTSDSQNENTNTTRRRPRRRTRRRAAANANMSGDANMNMSGDTSGGQDANANMSGDTSGNANMSGDMSGNMNMGGRRRRRGRRNRATAATDTSMQDANANMSASGAGMERTDGGAQADLSGTYTGTVNYPEGGMTGPATMTITGTQFSITPEGGGAAVNGTITAVTTRGYTGATMMFGDRGSVPPTQAPPPLPAVSVRAKKTGTSLWLMSVKGEKREFSFTSGGGGGSGRRRGRRSRAMRHSMPDTNRGGADEAGIKPPTAKPTP